MIPLVLQQMVKSLPKHTSFQWVRDSPTTQELDYLREQALSDSKFDPFFLRKTTYQDLLDGKATLLCRRGPFARILAIVYHDSLLPWNLYSKIFSAFGPPKSCAKGNPRTWTVYIFANESPRMYPPIGSPVAPEHINGGYAMHNDPNSIVIYRKEESERVLLHELLHACGSDLLENSTEIREALTETWAELFLIAVMARGSLQKAKKLWAIQSQWISDQNAFLYFKYNVKEDSDYAWRYTIAREGVFKSIGILLPPPNMISLNSLRFTSPYLLS
jgi:hypothetical protein